MKFGIHSLGYGIATVVLLGIACGGQTGQDGRNSEAAQPDASPGDPTSGTGSANVTTGGSFAEAGAATSVGGSSSAGARDVGAGGHAGMGGSTDLCPEIDCDLSCPSGWWLNVDGCYACACAAPPLTMPLPYPGAPPDQFSLSGEVSEYNGGLDTLTIRLVWRYDVEEMEDEELTVRVTLMVVHPPHRYDLDVPFTHDVLAEPALVAAAIAEWGGPTDDLQTLSCLGGFLTLSWVGERLQGGVELQLSSMESAVGDSIVAGPFDLPAP